MQVLVCILLLSLTQYCSSEEETLGKVVFANVLFRHGYRTPNEIYPNDPYKNESLWPVPFGQLTNLGKHQHLMLGRWLRDRYAHLLSTEYSARDIYVRSTDVDRTLMSAEANLAGMYPPSGDQIWDIEKWMPIPVHTVPEKDDYLLAGRKYCARYSCELERVKHSAEMKKIDEENAVLYEYLSKMSGDSIFSLETVGILYNTLHVEDLHNKTLPAWTKSVYPNKMKPLAEKGFKMRAYNKILQRLQSGPLLKNMIEHMKLKSNNSLTPNRKLWVYSAHDWTIANMLMTLGVFEPHCPPFAATLLIELRINAQDDYVVTVFYKNSTDEPTLLTLPGCLAACPLNQFVRLTKDVIPDDWEQECSSECHVIKDISFQFPLSILFGFCTMIVMLVAVLIVELFEELINKYTQLQTSASTDVPEIIIHHPEDSKVNLIVQLKTNK